MNRFWTFICMSGLACGCASGPQPAMDASKVAAPAQPANARAEEAVRLPAASLDELKARLLELKELKKGGDLRALPDEPVFVEFKGSPHLSKAVANDLQRRGAKIAAAKEQAAGVLTLSGRVQLEGSIGRLYFDIGETFEKIAATDAEAARIGQWSAANQAVASARDAAFARGFYEVGLFDKFTLNYFTVVALADALGLGKAFNTLIAGDPRGFCLTNCEHWKHIHHRMIVFANWNGKGESWKGFVEVKAWMKQIDPQPVFDVAYETLVSEALLPKERR